MLLAIATGRSLWHQYVKKTSITEEQEISNKDKPRNRRVKAIDAFRGYINLLSI